MTRKLHSIFIVMLILMLSSTCYADEVFRLRMFFGLSLPGGGAVSLADWQSFHDEEIVGTFDGFNVVDSVGYYRENPERSKIVTVILKSKDIPEAKKLASLYSSNSGDA